MESKPGFHLENYSFLPKITQNTPALNNSATLPFNSMPNTGFLPAINTNSHLMESLKELKRQKMQKIEKKKVQERVYKALEKQTEMLAEISKRFKKQAEEEETKLLKKIKELERENNEILWQRRNEDLIQQKVMEKLKNLNEINAYNFQYNPFYSFLNPMAPPSSDSESEKSEKPKKKNKKKGKKKKVAGKAEKDWDLDEK